jgi:predicted nucleic acid-binding protein
LNSLDTNILVYATDETDVAKHIAARKLLDLAVAGGWPVAAQVYGEYFSVVTRRRLTTRAEAREVIEAWSESMVPLPSTVTAHAAALGLATEKQMQYWDALIIATCAEQGVKQLYTEDIPGSPKPLGVRCTLPW